jgi:hypothetical protein
MFEIVKRQHIRPAGNLVPRTSHGPQPWASDMLGKQKHVFGESRRQVFLLDLCSALAERTLIMRVIKCRKSIWWMPWR